MKIRINKLLLVGLLVILGYNCYSIGNILMVKTNINNIKEVHLNDNFENKSALAIMIQNDDYSWSEAKDRNAWPDIKIYTYTGTECTDSEGAELNSYDYISFDETENVATINTKDSIYCTLYFSKGRSASEVLRKNQQGNGSQTFQSDAVFGLYRFVGTKDQVNNNYICFGTTNKDTCLNDATTYMYRIIGITDNSTTNSNLGIPENSLKIIKATSIGNYSFGGPEEIHWDEAVLNKSTLNQTFYDTIVEKSGVNWKNLILHNHYWYVGSVLNYSSSEETTKSTTNNPIGIMYQSDYYNAGTLNTNNWLFIKNGWTNVNDSKELTMTPYGKYYICNIGSNGNFDEWGGGFGASFPTRPSFYLRSDVTLSGSGSISNPYIITNKN